MQRGLIIFLNCALLVVLLIGVPAATHEEIGKYQLSSIPTDRLVMQAGLGMAAGVNLLGALVLIKAPKNKTICWEWSGIFAALWLAYFSFIRGWINFIWLKKSLLWLDHHL